MWVCLAQDTVKWLVIVYILEVKLCMCATGRLKKGSAAWHLVNGSHIETLEF